MTYLGHSTATLGTDDEPKLTGLCLSGGGVRSAIFCGGVLEYLGAKKMLSKFDYVSTVSGGGYTGAALSYWSVKEKDPDQGAPLISSLVHMAKRGLTGEDDESASRSEKPKPTDPFEYHPSYIRHLRANISYLMPTGFRDAMVGTYVVLRSIIINMMIWIGLAAVLFEGLLKLNFREDTRPPPTGAQESSWPGYDDFLKWFIGSDLFMGIAVVGLVSLLLLVLLIPIFSFGTLFKRSSGYRWRKRVERLSGALLIVTLFCIPFGFLPVVTERIGDIHQFLTDTDGEGGAAPLQLGIIGSIMGSAISIFGLFRARLGGIFGGFSGATIVLGAVLLITSAAMLSMYLAQTLDTGSIICIGLFSFALAFFCSLNDASLGRFYRDRLMEAFMPDKEAIKAAGDKGQPLARPGTGGAWQADRLRLTDLDQPTQSPDGSDKTPIHLINANVLSWWAKDSRALRRKGDNFILSPLFCGSDMTKWKRTKNVANNRLTLATAMAVSGAAVNPQGGFAGQGPTTSWPVSLAMAFLSLRLGYWLVWKRMRLIPRFGNHIHPGLTQLLRRLTSSEVSGSTPEWGNPSAHTPSYLELSDGGHFDNLGLYEMIRRECRLIVVCDGGHDPENSYAAFSTLIRRVSEDFGAKIKFDVEFNDKWSRRAFVDTDAPATITGPQDVVARPVKNQYPRDTEYAQKGYFLASVTYGPNPQEPAQDGYRAGRNPLAGTNPAPRKGLIVYLKSALIRDLELTTKGYRGSNPLFPFDPTSNQFFSPEQFEAYRDLGQKVARQMDHDLVFDNLFEELTKAKSDGRIEAKLARLDMFA